MAFVTEQDDVGDGVVEHWTILDGGAGPGVTMVQILHGHRDQQRQVNWTVVTRWCW